MGDVRNCPDGTVEIRAEGDREALMRFRSRLSEGPPMARVDEVEDLELLAESEMPAERFEILQ